MTSKEAFEYIESTTEPSMRFAVHLAEALEQAETEILGMEADKHRLDLLTEWFRHGTWNLLQNCWMIEKPLREAVDAMESVLESEKAKKEKVVDA